MQKQTCLFGRNGLPLREDTRHAVPFGNESGCLLISLFKAICKDSLFGFSQTPSVTRKAASWQIPFLATKLHKALRIHEHPDSTGFIKAFNI